MKMGADRERTDGLRGMAGGDERQIKETELNGELERRDVLPARRGASRPQ